jgi:murein L,D-transpeptidase YcbB/YkuD
MLFCSTSSEAEESTAPISGTNELRAAVQTLAAERFSRANNTRNEAKALLDYYSEREGVLLWVDQSGLTPRATAVIEEIKKADDYGLRASDYDIPKASAVEAENKSDVAWLADAEIELGLAVLRYARDARGGRLNPQRLSKHLDPALSLPDPLQVIKSIALSSDPAAYLRSFQPDQPQFQVLRQRWSRQRANCQPHHHRGSTDQHCSRRVRAGGAAVVPLQMVRRPSREETLFDLRKEVEGFKRAVIPDGLFPAQTASISCTARVRQSAADPSIRSAGAAAKQLGSYDRQRLNSSCGRG